MGSEFEANERSSTPATTAPVELTAEEQQAAMIAAENEARRREVSDEMRAKLRRELQSQGADPNVSGGNPILIISGVVAILVLLGGKGYFY